MIILQHAVTTEGKTLLPHYLGMYRLTVNNTETYWIVMRNVLSSSVTIHRKFDLKGSTVDRAATHKEKVCYVYNDSVWSNVWYTGGIPLTQHLNKTGTSILTFGSKCYIIYYVCSCFVILELSNCTHFHTELNCYAVMQETLASAYFIFSVVTTLWQKSVMLYRSAVLLC